MDANVCKLKLCKCEDCGGDAVYCDWPAGWMQTGKSKYGKMYAHDGVAWHCPRCRQKYDPGTAPHEES